MEVAGTILFLRQEVIRGLTTAAGLWTVAGIGLIMSIMNKLQSFPSVKEANWDKGN